VEANEVFYCCAHCAGQNGVQNLKDHVVIERSTI
jgi:hypothetical protein